MSEKHDPALTLFKRWLVGAPLRSMQASHERLSNPIALAIFASDALSSTAYATEEILMVLTLAVAMAATSVPLTLPIAIAIAVLIGVVTLSYRQLIFAYPEGGGAYTVARENLSTLAGNIAGASLLIDYVLTVAVSCAAGIAALISAVPALADFRVPLAGISILMVMLGNLRGVRESGALFAIPAYVFIASFFGMIGWGLIKSFTGAIEPLTYPIDHMEHLHDADLVVNAITPLLVLRAFSSGCAALTGLEAISNGTGAFRAPESKNAAIVMSMMALILGSMFVGLSYLAVQYHILPYSAHQEGYQTVVAQIAEAVSGERGWMFYLIQGSTMVVLLLAANTAFAGFPRLASLLAKDGYLPRQFATMGDKLVFTNGIVILALISFLLIVLFEGDTHKLIPLYAVGVFLGFTLAQVGMVQKWLREKPKGWGYSVAINGLGGALTLTVLVVIAYTKFTQGAWIVLVLIPAMIWVFHSIKEHYAEVADQLSLEGRDLPDADPHKVHHTVIIPIGGIQYSVVQALHYAQSLSPDDVRAVYVNINQANTAKLEERWPDWGLGVTLVVLESQYRSILEPLLAYLDMVQQEQGVDYITVLLPEFVTAHWWEGLLHNQTAIMIRTYLGFRRNVVVTSVRYHLEDL